ncbi:hypothetical protein [Oryzihumus leptocrescens]|uniref:Uncharacterized protein n=1 Tax=Oryzihumus leptocrescens TaxID=297536 RepID=A0A542ZGS9_9MICO|nr:hypothetical protein [Oryzihumus leptocrescens]TQL59499.1 hypothetical protein FB474_0854 [Oryzihumus leptocrescens]
MSEESVVDQAAEVAQDAVRAVDRAVPAEEGVTDRELGRAGRRAAWAGPVFTVLAAAMVPWTVFLAVTLPSKQTAAHYDLAWVGFDLALLAMLTWTAWSAFRRSPVLTVSASMTAMMLLVDAWFDVVTAPSLKELALSLPMALLVEVPLAAVCLWLARNGQRIAERLVVIRLRRRRRAHAR